MGRPVQVKVSDRQRLILGRWVRNRAETPYRVVERSRIVLMSADGLSNVEQAARLGVDRQRVGRWRKRWAWAQGRLAEAERAGASDKDLTKVVADVLADADRPGAPSTFTAEQLTQIIAVACEPPADSGLPVTHWTPPEVAREVIKRGIVETISPRHVDRVLKGGISVGAALRRTRAGTG